jgi:protein-disulfide isomerase
VLAAQNRGKLWPFVLALDDVRDRIDEKIVVHIADSLGISGPEFNADLVSNAILSATGRSKNEGIRNGIKYTPGVFINNRLYSNYKDPQWIIDAIDWEYERVALTGGVKPRPIEFNQHHRNRVE